MTVLYFEFFKTKITDSKIKKQNDTNSTIKNKPIQKVNNNLKKDDKLKNVKDDKNKKHTKKGHSKTKPNLIEFNPESSEDECANTDTVLHKNTDIPNTTTKHNPNQIKQDKTNSSLTQLDSQNNGKTPYVNQDKFKDEKNYTNNKLSNNKHPDPMQTQVSYNNNQLTYNTH